MPLIPWDEKMIIHVQSMDFQHQHWVRLMNQLHEAMLEGKGSLVIHQTLSDALGYTRVHFTSEERLLSENGYPAYNQHKKIHADFIEKILNLQDRLDKGHMILAIEIMKEMRNWLTQHIQDTDRQYVSFLKQKGVA
jgi:hemerythrin